MKNKITRHCKKKLRAIMLCHTGNPACRKAKYSKSDWLKIRTMYDVWFRILGTPSGMGDRKTANTVKR
jgi:hypothetical protein